MQTDSDNTEWPTYPISSVDKALRLLLFFRENSQLRLSDASGYLNVAHSTAHRLLAMLIFHGFVRQDTTQRIYLPGPVLVEIGLATVRNLDLRSKARPFLERLSADCGETAHLSQMEGTTVRYLDAVESSHVLRVAARTGTTLPANCSASGKAILAQLGETELDKVFAGHASLPAATDRSVTDLERLRGDLEIVRDRGFSVNDQESEDGVISVAVAVIASSSPLGALSVSAPVDRTSWSWIEETGAVLRRTARELEESISREPIEL
ncbi:IclR family transcriptional regulator [Nocardiopsis nanhaiensis]